MAGHDIETPAGKLLKKQLGELEKLQVRVGYQHGAETGEDGGADLADVAMWNELGTAHMPARPFLRQSVDGNASRISAACKAQLQAVASGKATAEGALAALGAMQKGLVQHTIQGGGFKPNAPATVKRKGSDRPLIDTGRMRQSVTFAIVPKGG